MTSSAETSTDDVDKLAMSAKCAETSGPPAPAETVIISSPVDKVEKRRFLEMTRRWLEENYYDRDGICLPRNLVYGHYLDFCSRHGASPACAATFGKTIRLKFPHVTTRRLGTRGHSRYHYYGIGIRESSPYYSVVFSATGLTRFSGAKMICEGGFTRQYSLASKVGTVLPDFPSVHCLQLPDYLPSNMVESFLAVYRAYNQMVLDLVTVNDFTQIEMHMMRFWTELPENMAILLGYESVAEAICSSDSTVHKTLIDVLIPATMQEMPERLLTDVATLARCWPHWIRSAVAHVTHVTPSFVEKKLTGDRQFASSLLRHVTFLRLAQAVRPVLYDAQLVNQIIVDIDLIDFNCLQYPLQHHQSPSHQLNPTSQCGALVTSDGAATGGNSTPTNNNCDEALTVLKEFREMLHKQATVEAFVEWLDISIQQKIIVPNRQDLIDDGRCHLLFLQQSAQDFLLRWSFYGSRLAHSLTLNNAASFVAIHLIHLLLTEYLLLAIESQLELGRRCSSTSGCRVHSVSGASSRRLAVTYSGDHSVTRRRPPNDVTYDARLRHCDVLSTPVQTPHAPAVDNSDYVIVLTPPTSPASSAARNGTTAAHFVSWSPGVAASHEPGGVGPARSSAATVAVPSSGISLSLSERQERPSLNSSHVVPTPTPTARRSTGRDAAVNWCRSSLVADWDAPAATTTNCGRVPSTAANGDRHLTQPHYGVEGPLQLAKKSTSRARRFDFDGDVVYYGANVDVGTSSLPSIGTRQRRDSTETRPTVNNLADSSSSTTTCRQTTPSQLEAIRQHIGTGSWMETDLEHRHSIYHHHHLQQQQQQQQTVLLQQQQLHGAHQNISLVVEWSDV